MKKPCLNYYIDLALNRCVSICDFEIQYYERQPGHTAYNNMDCLTCVVLNILYAQCYSLKPYYNKCIDMVCLFVCFDVSKKITTLKERLVTMFTLKRFSPSVYFQMGNTMKWFVSSVSPEMSFKFTIS